MYVGKKLMFKNWAMPGLYSYFSSFQTVDSIYKISQRLDSNCRRLNLEATDLPTARQRLATFQFFSEPHHKLCASYFGIFVLIQPPAFKDFGLVQFS